MLRPFGDTTLARLALDKISRSREVDVIYYAANGAELLAIARDFPNVRVIERSRSSALGEDAPTIYDFMDQIEEPLIASMNACCPFLRIETFDDSVRKFKAGGYRSLLAAIGAKEWYWDEQGRPLTALDASIINSKMMPKVYRSAHAFLHFKKAEFLRDNYRIWSLQPGDPYLFDVSAEEAIDINDEFEFEVAESLYTARLKRKACN
jgi:CMP-N-acetylneuraminic acid synthetase